MINNNIALAKYLVERNAHMFNQEQTQRDLSPFFIAIKIQSIWAIELFVDLGADLDFPSSEGTIPLFYAANLGYDEVAMYLCLRCDNISM